MHFFKSRDIDKDCQTGLLSIEDQSHHKRRPLFEQATRNKNHYEVIKCLLENGYHLKHDNSSMISAFTLPYHPCDLRGTSIIYDHFKRFSEDQSNCESVMKHCLQRSKESFERYFNLKLEYFKLLYFEKWTEDITVNNRKINFILQNSPTKTMLFILTHS